MSLSLSFLCSAMWLNIQKCSEHGVVYSILTSRCASCHKGVHFFNNSTSKSAPALMCIVHFDFEMCFAPQRRAIIQHLNGVLCILTSRCASCHNGVHFFNTSASKSAPALRCIVHFDFEMCFAPQQRAIIQHLNFQKCSGVEVSCAV